MIIIFRNYLFSHSHFSIYATPFQNKKENLKNINDCYEKIYRIDDDFYDNNVSLHEGPSNICNDVDGDRQQQHHKKKTKFVSSK